MRVGDVGRRGQADQRGKRGADVGDVVTPRDLRREWPSEAKVSR